MSSSNSERERHRGPRGCKVRASRFATYNVACAGPFWVALNRINAHNDEVGHRIATTSAQRCSKVIPRRVSVEFEAQQATATAEEISRPLATGKTPGDSVDESVGPGQVEKLIAETTSEVLDDSSLLKGRVPQFKDWLEAWAESTEQVAFHKQERLARKKKSERHRKKLRRIRRKQVRIMAEARRDALRKQLSEARFISLSMDEQ